MIETQEERRFFKKDERFALWFAAGGRCKSCGEKLTRSFHADHKVPHSRGGKTDLSNGQALCPDCNLKKGDRMASSITLRDWQVEYLEASNNSRVRGNRDVLLVACPGGGKTLAALVDAKKAKDAGLIDYILLVVPSTHLKKQWKKIARELGISLCTDIRNEDLRYGEPDDADGLCLTYMQVGKAPLNPAGICQSRRVLAILDEVHHASDQKTWGKAIFDGFCNARYRLLLSGTPFRSDGTAIPFVRYDEAGYCVPDYSYGYGRAVAEGVCREVLFPTFEGTMEWINGENHRTASFDDDLDEQGESHRLRTALSTDGTLLLNMLERAHERLMAIRAGEHKDAAGLAVAMNINHALEMAALMRRHLKVDPVVVHSDDDQAGDNIAQFTDSTSPWIIAVNMISEGVDIPRLRVGVYGTCIISRLFFLQVIARIARMVPGIDQQTAYFYLPADRRLMEFAREVRRDVFQAMTEREPEVGDGGGSDGPGIDPPRLSTFFPLNAHGDEDGHIIGDDFVPVEELEHARNLLGRYPALRGMPEATLALILREHHQYVPSQSPQASSLDATRTISVTPVPDRDVEHKKLSDRVNRVVTSIVNETGRDYGDVHGPLNRMAGISSQPSATRQQLLIKLRLAQEELEKVMGRGFLLP